MEKEIPDKNLFMMCKKLNTSALAELQDGYYVRTCRRDELDIWKKMPFDDEKTAEQYSDFMTKYFNDVYASKKIYFLKSVYLFVMKTMLLSEPVLHGRPTIKSLRYIGLKL